MTWQGTLYTIPLVVGAVIAVVLALYIRRRHRVAAAKTVAVALLAGAGWLLSYTLRLSSTDLPTKIFWNNVKFLPAVIAYAAFFVFTLQYTGREKWVTRHRLMFLGIEPVITLLLIFNKEYFKLMYSSRHLIQEGNFWILECPPGPWFWVHTTYSAILVLSGDFLLIHMLIRAPRFYRWQITSLLAASFLLLLHGVLPSLRVFPMSYRLATILFFFAAAPAVALSIFRFRVADIVPVARGAVIDGMSDGVIVLDPQNHIMDVNPLVQRLAGCPISELIGKPVEEVWPEWSNQIELSSNEIKAGKEIVTNLEDEQRIYDVGISPLTDLRGDSVSQIVVLRDITERKQAERKLHESEEKFRSITERNFDAIYELDLEGRITYVSPALERITGYTPEEILGNPIQNFIPKSKLPEAASAVARVVKGEIVEGLQIEIIRKDGSLVFVEFNACPIIDDGKVIGSQGVARDITERKKAEEVLKQSRLQLKNLFEASKLINSTMDIGELYKFASDSVQKLVGFDYFIIFLVSEDKKRIYPAYTSERIKENENLVFDYGKGLIGQCIETGEILLLDNTHKEGEVFNMLGMKSRIIVPLIVENLCVGALHISKRIPNAYTQDDVDVLNLLSEVVSSAIRKSWLHNEMKKFSEKLEERVEEKSRRTEIILNTRQNLQTERNWEKGLTTIVESMSKLEFEQVGVFLVNPVKETLEFHFGKGVDLPKGCTSIPLKNLEYFGVQCVLKKETIHVEDSSLAKGKQIIDSNSFVWVPIIVRDEAFAALAASNVKSKKMITDEDVKDLEILAGMCAAFIDRTRTVIEPVAENSLKTEIKHSLDPMGGYIILEKKPEKSFEIFVDLVTHGISGFVVSREYPEKLKEKYRLVKTPTLWLSKTEIKNAINPDDLPKLYYIIGGFTKESEESVILLDGLEYLITHNDFNTVLKCLQELKDTIILNNSRLIIPVHKDILSPKEFSMLEREFAVLKPD